MRKTVIFVTVVLIGMVWGSQLIAADEMCVPMGEMTIEPLVEEAKRSEVTFRHKVHFGYNCRKCHHKWSGQEPITGCATSGCHDLDISPKAKDGKPTKDPLLKIRYYKSAYHQMCIGCHKEIKLKNKKMEAAKASLGEKLPATGPTGCNQCHPKE